MIGISFRARRLILMSSCDIQSAFPSMHKVKMGIAVNGGLLTVETGSSIRDHRSMLLLAKVVRI